MNAKNVIQWSSLPLLSLVFASQPAIAATDVGTLTVGHTAQAGCFTLISGFASGVYGSYAPAGLTGGKTVNSVFDRASSCVPGVGFSVSGFSSNPGTTWLTSITCNGVTNNGGSAGFSYSGGVAFWGWGANYFGFNSLAGV